MGYDGLFMLVNSLKRFRWSYRDTTTTLYKVCTMVETMFTLVTNGFVCQWQPIVRLSSRHAASQPKPATGLSDLHAINIRNKAY